MHVVNTDALYYQNKSPEKCLLTVEKDKQKKHLEACLRQRCHLSTFFVSVYGFIVMEEEATMKRIARSLVTKCKHTYYRMCGFVNIRVVITLTRATHRCIQGYRVPALKISAQKPQWEDSAGLHLF